MSVRFFIKSTGELLRSKKISQCIFYWPYFFHFDLRLEIQKLFM